MFINPFPAEVLKFKVATLRGNSEPLNLLKQLAFPHSAFQDEQNEWSHYRVLTTGSTVEISEIRFSMTRVNLPSLDIRKCLKLTTLVIFSIHRFNLYWKSILQVLNILYLFPISI